VDADTMDLKCSSPPSKDFVISMVAMRPRIPTAATMTVKAVKVKMSLFLIFMKNIHQAISVFSQEIVIARFFLLSSLRLTGMPG
jgi:hypothetical protein